MSLKEKINKKEVTVGSWITIGDCSVAEIMAKSGFDWLVVDMEHSAIDISIAQDLIRIIDLCGVTPLVRVGENDATIIKRVMDAGAQGVIVPMVNTKADALKAVASVKYPPVGTRGVGLARAQGYGLGFNEYKEWVNEGSIVIVQIEHIDAVKNLEDILSVAGVDGFIIGPYDLSASMGKPGVFDDPEVKKALEKVKEISANYDVTPGFHVIPPDAAEIFKKVEEGYKFIAFSLDSLFFSVKCTQEMEKIKILREQENKS